MATHYVDGAGYNGEYSAIAIVSPDLTTLRINPKEYTGNEMEYAAMFYYLDNFAKDGDTVYSDAQVIVKQLNGEYKIRAKNLCPLYDACKKLLKKKRIKIKWIPRERNKAGKVLEKIKRIDWLK